MVDESDETQESELRKVVKKEKDRDHRQCSQCEIILCINLRCVEKEWSRFSLNFTT